MKYSEYPYKRANIKELKLKTEGLIKKFNAAKNVQEQINIIYEYQKTQKEISSFSSIAHLNFARNTKDINSKKENEYYNQINPEIKAIDNLFIKTLNKSKFKKELIQKFGKHYFNLIDMELKSFDPKMIDLMKKENDLINDYNTLIANAEIKFNGKTLNLTGLAAYKQDVNRDIRKKAFKATNDFFLKNEEKLDSIFDKLVKIRHNKSQVIGLKNFTPLGYLNMNRSDYGPKEVKEYRKQIVKHIVPIAEKIKEKRRKKFNYKKMYCYDTLFFQEGNPKPKGNKDHLVKQAQKMYKELSPETDEFFNIMINENLMDLENRPGKRGGGFCTSFPSLERPYIFANFNGTDHDVTVLTHEAGHAFQCYQSRKQPLDKYLWPTYEACEIHSMSMEFLTWEWMNLFFQEDTKKFLYKHLCDSLTTLPWLAIVDHFQHWIYENPFASPKERKQEWRNLEKIYFPSLNYDDLNFFKNGGRWQQQLHIYNLPFYYIDYSLAQVCAFQFWIKMQENKKEAWEDYLRLCKAGGSMSFLDLVKLANLKSPFDPKVFEQVASKISKWISENNM